MFIPILTIGFCQTDKRDKISLGSSLAGGNVHFLYCIGGFGGGNVAATIGDDGILLVDDMYGWMAPKLETYLKSVSDKPIRIVLNTHFHRDHIEGNKVLRNSSVIIAQERVKSQLEKNDKAQTPTNEMIPLISFTDSIKLIFNGEEIKMIHFPNSHTDGDAVVYFTKSKVLHLGDMFFNKMFPAVYAQGGGDIKNLIVSLEKILMQFPPDVKVVPGHGELASMSDLADYVKMLRETTRIVEVGISQGKTLEQMTEEKLLAAYDALGRGGAQTTDQYLSMLYKLLAIEKK